MDRYEYERLVYDEMCHIYASEGFKLPGHLWAHYGAYRIEAIESLYVKGIYV
jgi:hypothetical protein